MDDKKKNTFGLVALTTTTDICCFNCEHFGEYECGGSFCKRNIFFYNSKVPTYYSCILFQKLKEMKDD